MSLHKYSDNFFLQNWNCHQMSWGYGKYSYFSLPIDEIGKICHLFVWNVQEQIFNFYTYYVSNIYHRLQWFSQFELLWISLWYGTIHSVNNILELLLINKSRHISLPWHLKRSLEVTAKNSNVTLFCIYYFIIFLNALIKFHLCLFNF